MKFNRLGIQAEFAKLRALPGLEESLSLKLSNGDKKKFKASVMPSTARIQEVNIACKLAFSKKK